MVVIMAELNKNVLTDEQKLVKEVIDKMHCALKISYEKFGYLDAYDLEKVIKAINREYKLIPQYDTLGEYINEHKCGAYHKFRFYIDGKQFECIDVSEFKDYYNPEILKDYVVVNVEQKDNGGNVENYECVHNLTLKRKEEFE
jgi:hypothetical protein